MCSSSRLRSWSKSSSPWGHLCVPPWKKGEQLAKVSNSSPNLPPMVKEGPVLKRGSFAVQYLSFLLDAERRLPPPMGQPPSNFCPRKVVDIFAFLAM